MKRITKFTLNKKNPRALNFIQEFWSFGWSHVQVVSQLVVKDWKIVKRNEIKKLLHRVCGECVYWEWKVGR